MVGQVDSPRSHGLAQSRQDAENPSNFSKNGAVGSSVASCPREFLRIEWGTEDVWCSENATLRGTTRAYNDGDSVDVIIKVVGSGSRLTNFAQTIRGNSFSRVWRARNVRPRGRRPVQDVCELLASCEGQTTPTRLQYKFIPTLPKTEYHQGRHHFELEVTDYVAKVHGDIRYIKGWAASVVKLGATVPANTGGLLDGQLDFPGYRWLKKVGLTNKYWNGSAWQNLPAAFTLIDANNFCVGFYKNGQKYTCQYGGDWPETFSDWNIDSQANQAKITAWEDNIRTVWTGQFHLQRQGCISDRINNACCKYSTRFSANFRKRNSFRRGMLVIAPGNIRSNDSLLFIEEPRIAVAAHEFGHHIGNPDEYAGAAVDTSLNEDGAVNGIDEDSIMGQNLTTVKKRHFRTVCAHLASMVNTETGKSYTYEAV